MHAGFFPAPRCFLPVICTNLLEPEVAESFLLKNGISKACAEGRVDDGDCFTYLLVVQYSAYEYSRGNREIGEFTFNS